MQMRLLHGYKREDGGVSVSPHVMASGTEDAKGRIRLVADEGMAITNGKIITTVIDVDADDIGHWSDCAPPAMQETV